MLISLLALAFSASLASATIHITTYTGEACNGVVVNHRPVNDLVPGLWKAQDMIPGASTHSYEVKADQYIKLYTIASNPSGCSAPLAPAGTTAIGGDINGMPVTQRLCFSGSPDCKLANIQWWREE